MTTRQKIKKSEVEVHTDLPSVRADFPRDHYPIEIEAFHPSTKEVVWSTKIEEPDGLVTVYIPNLRRQFGHPVRMRFMFANGTTLEEPPRLKM